MTTLFTAENLLKIVEATHEYHIKNHEANLNNTLKIIGEGVDSEYINFFYTNVINSEGVVIENAQVFVDALEFDGKAYIALLLPNTSEKKVRLLDIDAEKGMPKVVGTVMDIIDGPIDCGGLHLLFKGAYLCDVFRKHDNSVGPVLDANIPDEALNFEVLKYSKNHENIYASLGELKAKYNIDVDLNADKGSESDCVYTIIRREGYDAYGLYGDEANAEGVKLLPDINSGIESIEIKTFVEPEDLSKETPGTHVKVISVKTKFNTGSTTEMELLKYISKPE